MNTSSRMSDISTQNKTETPSNNAITTEFREKIVTYLKIDDMIKNKLNEIRELKVCRGQCEKHLIDYLQTVGESILEIGHTRLRKSTYETKGVLKIDSIKSTLQTFIKDESQIDQIVNLMDEKRKKSVHTSIKRTELKHK
jgi:hypothetical protein